MEEPTQPQMEEPTQPKKTWTDEIEIAANELVDQVKSLLQEGNVRRLIIRRSDGGLLLEIPLTAGAAVGGALAIFHPVLAAVGAMAALLARVKIEIIREEAE